MAKAEDIKIGSQWIASHNRSSIKVTVMSIKIEKGITRFQVRNERTGVIFPKFRLPSFFRRPFIPRIAPVKQYEKELIQEMHRNDFIQSACADVREIPKPKRPITHDEEE